MTIETRQLRYFVAVAEELHFGQAARRLHMTQPPLSQAIQSLEASLGTALFYRTTRQISLTAAGKALLPEARRLLQHADELSHIAQRAATGETGKLSLAFVSIADYSVLPPSLRSFRHAYPNVQIELHEATSNVQLEALEKSEIDVGLLIPPIPDSSKNILDYRTIRTESLVLALPSHQKRKKAAQYLSTYKDLPLVLFPRTIAPALHDSILACFQHLGMTPVISQEAIQMQTIIALVSADMGIALVPQSVSNLQRPGVHYQALQDIDAKVEIGVAWRKDNDSPVLKAFLQQLEEQ
ncbi:LysR family transcriptional regulator [Undibacterium cyanobacteriorum]|uniref:LysR family transcriptional regulator n=1 Tax=Undibacterium cyanobacteriorum TaxID=3073561 RepID=A0ABY9RMT8_9BURK|nr:LysR family transcriptional regulator [Undibacterium sp. 20NA77.5]WMW82129.1 LysR family transcriptional regulator [Undibacterium sp. 20NA77.5]